MKPAPDFLSQYQECHDCGVKEGELHILGCDMERCPECGTQAITCREHCFYPDGSPRESFVKGDRYPYIIIPVYCCRCLEPYPSFFDADDWDEVVSPDLRGKVLCERCFEFVKAAWTKTRTSITGE